MTLKNDNDAPIIPNKDGYVTPVLLRCQCPNCNKSLIPTGSFVVGPDTSDDEPVVIIPVKCTSETCSWSGVFQVQLGRSAEDLSRDSDDQQENVWTYHNERQLGQSEL